MLRRQRDGKGEAMNRRRGFRSLEELGQGVVARRERDHPSLCDDHARRDCRAFVARARRRASQEFADPIAKRGRRAGARRRRELDRGPERADPARRTLSTIC